MIEIPEAVTLARQLNERFAGKSVAEVIAWQNPHKLAFIFGDPDKYGELLSGQSVCSAEGFGSWVEVQFERVMLSVSEGTCLLAGGPSDTPPKKHQLLVRFADGDWLCAYIKMYGGVVCAPLGEYDNEYYQMAKQRPSLTSSDFTAGYFNQMIGDGKVQKLSAKAFLATKQRIPGVGNGVLQDMLYVARVHPKRKINTLTSDERQCLFARMLETTQEMIAGGGRDTEKDLFGHWGGYATKMSKHTVGQPCPECETTIEKANYMGGSIYFCPGCQVV